MSIIVFYSARKLQNRAGRSAKQIFLAFKAHVSSRLPNSVYDPLYRYSQMDFSGESFMLNPHELVLYSFRWKFRELAEYIILASYRSYAAYAVDNTKTLELIHSPVTQETINNNRLLRIVGDKVHFYYEEDLLKRKKLWL